MLPQEVIRKKRDAKTLNDDEIRFLVRGITDESLTEGQAAAFAMAVFLRGMTRQEIVTLTREMMASGIVLDWASVNLDGPILDKHSSGGVGDKVSLMLAPMVAACGGFVPMISGRGLGHTGGTLDKLDSIPGYNTTPGIEIFQAAVKTAGCAIIGQTPDLAPADRRLYAIRDVTGTVETIPLLTSSILSKKLAAGLTGLVMDVKAGSGAFADNDEMANDLAESIVAVANGAGLPTTALITDMNQVLGLTAGNSLEVLECVHYLTGEQRESRLHEIVMALSGELLLLSGLAVSEAEASSRLTAALESGQAAEYFARMIATLGGPGDFLERPDYYLSPAPIVRPVLPDRAGTVEAMNTRALGIAVVELGGGRRRADDRIDHAVGLSDCCGVGQEVGPDRPLAFIHARNETDAVRVETEIKAAIRVSDGTPPSRPTILRRIEKATQ